MVKGALTSGADFPPGIALALNYAPPDRRPGLSALFALDIALGRVLRTTREPLVGQMRLTWWHEALERLDHAPPPAEPVLAALAREALRRGVCGTALAPLTDGWEALLRPELDSAAMNDHARQRGATLFSAAAVILGARDPAIVPAGEGWALVDLAANVADTAIAARARELAAARLATAAAHRWSREGRMLGALVHLARMEASGVTSPPRKLARLVWHRLTGR